MRPLPAWPTNTFQSPKLATRAGLAASSFFSVFAAALAGLVAAVAGGDEGARRQGGGADEPNGAERTKGRGASSTTIL